MIFLAMRSFLRYFVRNPQIISPEEIKEIAKQGKEVHIEGSFSVALAEALMRVGGDLEEVGSTDLLRELSKSAESSFIFARIGLSKADFQSSLEKAKSLSAVRFLNIIEKYGLKVTFYVTGKTLAEEWEDFKAIS